MGLVSSLPAQPPRRRMTKQDRRAQLLERAQAMFASHGFHHITMDEIAVAAQVSKPVLYRHFPSKRDLYLATIDDRKCALLRAVDDALDQSDIFNSPTAAPDLRHHRHDGAHDTSNTIGLATVRAIMRAYVEFAEQSGAVPPFSSNLTSPVMTISGKNSGTVRACRPPCCHSTHPYHRAQRPRSRHHRTVCDRVGPSRSSRCSASHSSRTQPGGAHRPACTFRLVWHLRNVTP